MLSLKSTQMRARVEKVDFLGWNKSHTPMFKMQLISYSDSVGLRGPMQLLTEYHFTARDPSAEAIN